MYANALAQVEPPSTSIHLIWSGPCSWVYSPGGWFIQRLDNAAIIQLRQARELRLRFGTLTLQKCSWPSSLSEPTPISPPEPVTAIVLSPPCEVFLLELDKPQPSVRVQATAPSGKSNHRLSTGQ